MDEDTGAILIISGPSGVGKTLIAQKIIEADSRFIKSISATTRDPREGERDGVDYYFKTEEEFQKMIDNKEFLEAAKIYGHFYGTTRNFVQRMAEEGKIVIFTIDWQGAKIVKDRARLIVKSVFIMPPNLEDLHKRMVERHQDSEEEMELRLKEDTEEAIKHQNEYDAVIINEDIDQAVQEIISIAKN